MSIYKARVPTDFPDMWSDLEAESAVTFIDPIAAMATILLNGLPSSARALLDEPGRYTAVQVAHAEWVAPVYQVLRGRHVINPRPNDSHTMEGSDEEAASVGALVISRTTSWTSGDRQLRMELRAAVARGRPVIAVTHDPQACLPVGLVHWATPVMVPAPTTRDLRHLLRRLTGQTLARISSDLAIRLTPEALGEAYLPGVGARALHDALVALTGAQPVTARSDADARLALRQHGVTAWGEGLAATVAAWRDGRGDWPRPSTTVLLAGTASAAHEVVGAVATLTRAQVIRVPLGRSEAVLAALARATSACRSPRRRTTLVIHVDAIDLLGMAHEPSRAGLVGLLEQVGPGVVVVGASDSCLAIDAGLMARFGRVLRLRQNATNAHAIH